VRGEADEREVPAHADATGAELVPHLGGTTAVCSSTRRVPSSGVTPRRTSTIEEASGARGLAGDPGDLEAVRWLADADLAACVGPWCRSSCGVVRVLPG
jgi:hypothetical protein